MNRQIRHVVGTSGYSFADWVGTFYPAGTQRREMFSHYTHRFEAVELNFTYYRMPAAKTLDRLARTSPEGFTFWIKANQETTHRHNRAAAEEFLENLYPLSESGKLAGVLMQFPQSFHRTVANRKYLAGTLADFAAVPAAVEFRHRTWDHPSVLAGLGERNVALVVPDVPDIADLYRAALAASGAVGYVRLHSRTAAKWYAGGAERYDYNYSAAELEPFIEGWYDLEAPPDTVYTFFNNCHRGQAAENAEAFRRLLGQIP